MTSSASSTKDEALIPDKQNQAQPIILAIENSGNCGSIALINNDHCMGEYSLTSSKTHSKRMLPAIHHLMEETQTSWTMLDAIAVSLGPGSFTGLRIGLSTAKGLCFAANLPLIGVSSLTGLANQFAFSNYQVCPLIDARKKEVYAALFDTDGKGSLTRISDDMVLSPESLARLIDKPTLLVGEGAEIYRHQLIELLADKAIIAGPHHSMTRASHIGLLALAKWQQQDFLDLATTVPTYVRASDAEIQRQKRN